MAMLFFSCESVKEIQSTPIQEEKISGGTFFKDDREIIISANNPTPYNVYFEGNIERKWINKNTTNNKVTLLTEDGTLSGGFDIFYDIPLTATVSIFCRGSHETFRVDGSYTIKEPRFTVNEGTYITILNRVNNAITFNTGSLVNALWEQTGSPVMGNNIVPTNKREFSFNETAVFKIDINAGFDNHFIRDSRKNTPLIFPYKIERNYRYTFEYNTDGLKFIDARPLHRIGEQAWVKPIDATHPMPLVATDNEIHLFASTGKDIERYTFDSAGNLKEKVQTGNGFYISSALQVENGFLIAGYEQMSNGVWQPVTRIHDVNGTMRSVLETSRNYWTGSFFTIASNKDTWLLAGEGARNNTSGRTAYARLVQNKDGKLTELWELGGNDFADNSSRIKCGSIEAAVYDNARDCWIITGESLEVEGSYIAEIKDVNNSRTIKINRQFTGMNFFKILTDSSGICYLAGEEYRGRETYAILVKYNLNNGEFTRISTQPPSHSYYQDAIFDSTSNRKVLVGVLQARDEYGQGGVPFIEAIDIAKGTLIWRERLSDSSLRGTSLATAIVPAPDYGFALTLSGININSECDKPYMIMRLNSEGKKE
jgi:hypothetical protein